MHLHKKQVIFSEILLHAALGIFYESLPGIALEILLPSVLYEH